MGWVENFRAAKAREEGGTPAYVPPPAQQYLPPPAPPAMPQQQQYAPPPPPPAPTGPAHAPYGYDPQTGTPVAPYGYDSAGRIVVATAVGAPQGIYDPSGQLLPHGYGQPPYGPVMGQQQQPVLYDQNGIPHLQPIPTADQVKADPFGAAFEYRGGAGVQSVGSCDRCGGDMLPITAENSRGAPKGTSVMRADGTIVYPAPQCANCGWNGVFQMGDLVPQGATVTLKGKAQPARTGDSDYRNLFAARNNA